MKRGGADDIFNASYSGNLARVKQLVEAGADVNAKNIIGTPLMIAAAHDFIDIVKYLLEKGADVNAKSDWGATACDVTDSAEIKALLCAPPPPQILEERSIPAGSETEIDLEPIQSGQTLVDFNEEYAHKRYYRPEVLSQIQPTRGNDGLGLKKRNPHTREPIGITTMYTARLFTGARRKKTRRNVLKKRTKKSKKTRKQ